MQLRCIEALWQTLDVHSSMMAASPSLAEQVDSDSDLDERSDGDELQEVTKCLIAYPGGIEGEGTSPVANSKRFAKLMVMAVLNNEAAKLRRVVDAFMKIEQNEAKDVILMDVYMFLRHSPGCLDFLKLVSTYSLGKQTIEWLAVNHSAGKDAFELGKFDLVELFSKYYAGRRPWNIERFLTLPDLNITRPELMRKDVGDLVRIVQKAASQGDTTALTTFAARMRTHPCDQDRGRTLQLVLSCGDLAGQTALSYACREGHEKAVEVLLDLQDGVYVDAEENWGRTPLEWAVLRGHFGIVKRLLEAGADPLCTPHNVTEPSIGILPIAAESRATSIVKLILEHLSSAGYAEGDKTRFEVMHAIQVAANRGYLDLLTILLQSGLVPFDKISDHERQDMIAGACSCNYWRALRLLLESGCDVDISAKSRLDGVNVLEEAFVYGSRKCVRELLLRKGSGLYTTEQHQVLNLPCSLLKMCVSLNDMWGVSLLLRAGMRDGKDGVESLEDDDDSLEDSFIVNDDTTAAELAKMAGNDALADYVKTFQMSLQDRCLCVIRSALAHPLRKTARQLPLPSSSIRQVLFQWK